MSGRVLIVEDNPIDYEVVKLMVEDHGYITIHCDNGIEALNFLSEEQSLSLIIIDLQMPKMPGIELLKRIRRLENFRKIPILIMSARNQAEDVQVAIKSGANDYVVKPLDSMVFNTKFLKLVKNSTERIVECHLDEDDDSSEISVLVEAKLKSVSEVGIKIFSSTEYTMGELVQFTSGFFSEIDISTASLTVQSCVKVANGFEIKLNFVGMTEPDRKKIRLFARKKWAIRKSEEMALEVKNEKQNLMA